MEEKIVTINLDRKLAEDLETYAARHNTSLTQLVIEFLRALVEAERPRIEDTPILQKLTGILPSSVSEASYREYLIDKHEP